jgi:Poxvirus D5 protein-like
MAHNPTDGHGPTDTTPQPPEGDGGTVREDPVERPGGAAAAIHLIADPAKAAARCSVLPETDFGNARRLVEHFGHGLAQISGVLFVDSGDRWRLARPDALLVLADRLGELIEDEVEFITLDPVEQRIVQAARVRGADSLASASKAAAARRRAIDDAARVINSDLVRRKHRRLTFAEKSRALPRRRAAAAFALALVVDGPEALVAFLPPSDGERSNARSEDALDGLAINQDSRHRPDLVPIFASTMLLRSPGEHTQARELYDAYTAWSKAQGVRPCSETQFAQAMQRLGYERDLGRVRYYLNVIVVDGLDTIN